MGALYILATIILTIYGQIVIKWQVMKAGAFPDGSLDRAEFLFRLALNPWVVSVWLGAALAALSWMAAMTKFQLNQAYPFMALTFIIVPVLSGFFFGERVSILTAVGGLLIVSGLIVVSQA